MITMLVTYAGDEQTPFDRDHWINVHLPLVRESWGPCGLVSAGGFFPQGDGAGLIAVAVVNFRDEAAMEAALNSPQTAQVMADVGIVTAVKTAAQHGEAALTVRRSDNLASSENTSEKMQMKTWLITGCSTGFGRRLALAAAQRGDRVIATARNVKTIEEMAEPFGGRMITLPLDVTDAAAAKAAVAKGVETFGGFDVLVNNAGYGLFGAIEEGAPEEYRPMFEVNVFGLIETTRAALPFLRRSGGTIVNMSSGAGIAGSGGAGYYNAAKFAVEGISEALAGELEPFGIRVLIVEPGPFRTDFLGRSITMAANEMPEYVASSRRHYRETNNGKQAGDPDKAVAVILQAVDADEAPLHLPLGPIAHSIAERKLAAFRSDIDAWRDLSIATDFDQP